MSFFRFGLELAFVRMFGVVWTGLGRKSHDQKRGTSGLGWGDRLAEKVLATGHDPKKVSCARFRGSCNDPPTPKPATPVRLDFRLAGPCRRHLPKSQPPLKTDS